MPAAPISLALDGFAVVTMAHPPVSSMGRGLELPLPEGLREAARCYAEAYRSADATEGIRAFLGQRAARFEGR